MVGAPPSRYLAGMSERRRATYADVLAAPEHLVAELVDGELVLSPRPAGPHALATVRLASLLDAAFGRGQGGPGGWLILFEPELHLGDQVLVPDLAGWRRERAPAIAQAAFSVAPDWICEVLSPSTTRLDRTRKLPAYARHGVEHVWLVDPLARTLEVLRRQDRHWLVVLTAADDERVRAEPFDAVELELGLLWPEDLRASGAAEPGVAG